MLIIALVWRVRQLRLTEGISVGGQRLIKQRETFAPVLLTNLSSVKMIAREA